MLQQSYMAELSKLSPNKHFDCVLINYAYGTHLFPAWTCWIRSQISVRWSVHPLVCRSVRACVHRSVTHEYKTMLGAGSSRPSFFRLKLTAMTMMIIIMKLMMVTIIMIRTTMIMMMMMVAAVRWQSNEQLKRDCTMGQNQVILRHRIIHFPMSAGVSQVSERANEWAVWVNEGTDEWVAQY